VLPRAIREFAVVSALVTAFAVGAASGVTFAAFTTTASSVGTNVTTKRIFPGTRTSPPFRVQDISGGGGGAAANSPYWDTAAPAFTSSPFNNAYGANNYVDLVFNNPLPGNIAVTSATFNVDAFTPISGTLHVYLQTLATTAGPVIANHGTAGAEFGSFSGTVSAFPVALPEVTSTNIANSIVVRVYAYGTHATAANRTITYDQASITLTTPYQTATLYPVRTVDSADSTPATFPWSLAAALDGSLFTNTSNWTTAFSATRYHELTFSGYAPAGATVTGATFTHRFGGSSGGTPCVRLAVYSNATLLTTHADLCNAGSAQQTTTISLPEINTVARANSMVLRVYEWITPGAAQTTQEDLMTVGVGYYLD
jgi:hypothetical protein